LDLIDGGAVEIVDIQLGHGVVDPNVSTKLGLVRTEVNLHNVNANKLIQMYSNVAE